MKKGFTLIELLVTVAIIGILASAVMVNMAGIRQRARDVQRKKDVLQIQAGLEWYRTDIGAYHPSESYPACGQALINGTTTYITKMPCDPLPGAAWGTSYFYASTGNAYSLYTCLENANDPERDATKQTRCGAAGASFTVQSL